MDASATTTTSSLPSAVATPAAPPMPREPLPEAHNGVLHPRQFAGIDGSRSLASKLTPEAVDSGPAPLALMGSTNGSAQAAATWRKPGHVLPYSQATMGSTFKPF